ncbi:hypothetical protein T458_23935 [Brevibacillus panacihumi W25]|uniref:PepSY domain-containing protein n=1 Tax=Brevibacillus panacihumi W25 TaxID=1408254 RepID=V6M9X4_9BACL|nr:DUF3221 domain-containing protein [Brevibacillus panacihumi]EST52148.1 hypothetical protein T458_23935 [Brevibacillus panacihumi W25]
MSKFLSVISLSVLVILTVGCSDDESKSEHKGLTGYVIEANYEKNALLVVESDKTAKDGNYDAEWYSLNDDAILLDSQKNKVLFTDIAVGAEVETWSTLPSLQSYPSQTDLSKLILADDVKHPNYPMVQKKAIQIALNFVKSLSGKPDILIVQSVVSNKSEWIIHIYNFNAEKKYELSVNAETGEVKQIK